MTQTATKLHAGGTLQIVGDSYRQDMLERIAQHATDEKPYEAELKGAARALARGHKRRWFQAVLFREPGNPHDPNAIAVHASGFGLIGYLDRNAAVAYRPVFEELARDGTMVGACPGALTGGGDGASWGVILALSSPEAILGDLRANP